MSIHYTHRLTDSLSTHLQPSLTRRRNPKLNDYDDDDDEIYCERSVSRHSMNVCHRNQINE